MQEQSVRNKGSTTMSPLHADFDMSLQLNSYMSGFSDGDHVYFATGTALTVQWENVQLKNNDQLDSGLFTFQVGIVDNCIK